MQILNDQRLNDEKVDFFLNQTNQFVENGYESFTFKIEFGSWWEDNYHRVSKRISFKKNYSKKPYLFLTMNTVEHFDLTKQVEYLLTNPNQSRDNHNIVTEHFNMTISIFVKQIMTSYFEIELEIFNTMKKNEVDQMNFQQDNNQLSSVNLRYLAINNVK